MIYPYCFYDERIVLYPVFPNLRGAPFILDLSPESKMFQLADMKDQRAFQQDLERRMEGKFSWGIGAYLERRDTVLAKYPQMVEEERFIHLGLDVIVPLGEKLHAPLDAVVQETGYEEGDGNYGGYVLLRHESSFHETFYSFYGHLRRATLPQTGKTFTAGKPFAEIGDFHENGNWFYHTHIQVLTQKGYELGYTSKGYCSTKDLLEIHTICPSPIPLFKPR